MSVNPATTCGVVTLTLLAFLVSLNREAMVGFSLTSQPTREMIWPNLRLVRIGFLKLNGNGSSTNACHVVQCRQLCR